MTFENQTPSEPHDSAVPPPPRNLGDDRADRRPSRRDGSRIFFGLLLLGFGAILFLDRLGLADADYLLDFWPLIPITLGLVKLTTGRDGSERIFGGILMFVFGGVMLDKLNLLDFDFDGRLIVPLVLMLIGFRILTRPRTHRSSQGGSCFSGRGSLASDRDADVLDGFAMLGALVRGSASQNFRGGKVTAVLAGAEIDLRQAKIDGPQAVIDTFTMWGGIEFVVPREWEVVVNGTPILGGFDDQTRHPSDPIAPRLIITGFAVMGGVGVRNENERGR